MKKSQQPEKIDEGGGEYRLRHPAFGAVRVTRSSGGSAVMFGSELNHQHQVRIVVTEAEMHRRHHEFVHHSGRTLLEFCMTETQWAQMVSSHGLHSGTPVTLQCVTVKDPSSPTGWRYEDMPYIERPPESHQELFDKEMRDKARKVIASMAEAVQALQELADSPKPPSRTAVREAVRRATGVLEHLPSGMEFLAEQFRSETSKITESAKIELEAIVNQVAVNTGIDALRNGAMPVLSLGQSKMKVEDVR